MDEEHSLGHLLWRAWSTLRRIDQSQLSDDDREKVNEAIEPLDEVEV